MLIVESLSEACLLIIEEIRSFRRIFFELCSVMWLMNAKNTRRRGFCPVHFLRSPYSDFFYNQKNPETKVSFRHFFDYLIEGNYIF